MKQGLLPRGQTVAAQVPYTKRKQEWIIASVVSWNEETNSYVVKDEFPENKKLKSWTIPQHKVIRFPRTNESWEQIATGDKVLSLWYMPDTAEWSSMFYEATIVNIEEGQAYFQGKVHLRFNGDNEVYDIDATKLVKKPKRHTKAQQGQKRSFSRVNGSHTRPGQNPYPERTRKVNLPARGGITEDWIQGEEAEPQPPLAPPNKSESGVGTAEDEASGQPPMKKQKLKTEKAERKARFKDPKGCGATNLQTYRYPDFCGVLGKKIKRMNAILNERNNEKL